MPAPEVRFGELDPQQCEAVLAHNHVGRLAYCSGVRVGLRPLHYVFGDGWIYGRTTEGEKIDALSRNWWVGFEVDEVDGPFDWRSVVVHGGFYALSPNGNPGERDRYERAVAAVRRVTPEAFGEGDPVPERTLVFGIAVQEMSGRIAWTGSAPPLIPAGDSRRPQPGA
jgi:nitroimidazol reductase NimA-like FMN-containing flavoprotein (pyridoxamine 5'-phosphate oxidase superfamily)